MHADIAIVIAGFNRPHSLSRLFRSLQQADYNNYNDISLIVSIDYSGNNECYKLAEDFVWEHGKKTIIKHPENLKLKNHIVKCGDLTSDHDAVIMLEDDLFVSPQFYDYAQQAYSFYKNDPSLAGIGLYNYRYNEFALCPFEALTDGHDNYFMQVPCSCGQLWLKEQWQEFRAYLQTETEDEEELFMPQAALNWPVKTSWKRSFFKYMVKNDKYFVYPRISLATNFGDIGEHYADSVYVWQTPLLYGRKNHKFSLFSESSCRYDSFFELEERAYNKISKKNISICFDLNGTKPLDKITSEYLVSSKYCSKPESNYLPALYPYECNILNEVKGDIGVNACFSFGKTSSFSDKRIFDRLNVDVSRTFFYPGYLAAAAKNEVYQTVQYRIGLFVLKPVNFIHRVINKLRSVFRS